MDVKPGDDRPLVRPSDNPLDPGQAAASWPRLRATLRTLAPREEEIPNAAGSYARFVEKLRGKGKPVR
jgi:hypothetical protein